VTNPTTPQRPRQTPARQHRRGFVPSRLNRLLATQRRAARLVETEPELLPITCRCGEPLGEAPAGEALWCRACGAWASAEDVAWQRAG
jgi:hypothetical protein